MLAHAIGKSHSYGCPPDVMECPIFDTGFPEDSIELPPKVVHYLKAGIRKCPLALWSENILNIVIPCWGDKNIRMSLWLLCLMICKHLNDAFCQGKSSVVRILTQTSVV